MALTPQELDETFRPDEIELLQSLSRKVIDAFVLADEENLGAAIASIAEALVVGYLAGRQVNADLLPQRDALYVLCQETAKALATPGRVRSVSQLATHLRTASFDAVTDGRG